MGKVKIGNFKGPQGETGPQGPAGPQGPEGPQGPMGAVDANTQIVFTQAASRENIASGEKFNIILGKIRKWFADLGTAAFKNTANNLTTDEEGSVLDARQGKALESKKLDKTKVINNLLTTQEGFALDARQGKVLDDKIDQINDKITQINEDLAERMYDQDTLSIADFYDVSAFDMRMKGNEVFLNISISLQSSAQFDPNMPYIINTKPIPEELRPDKTYHLQGFGCDSNWGQATTMAVIIEPSGYIKYTAPSRSAFFKLSGHWFTN